LNAFRSSFITFKEIYPSDIFSQNDLAHSIGYIQRSDRNIHIEDPEDSTKTIKFGSSLKFNFIQFRREILAKTIIAGFGQIFAIWTIIDALKDEGRKVAVISTVDFCTRLIFSIIV
jgi:hypothetical protein